MTFSRPSGAAVLALLLTLAGCGGGGSSNPAPAVPPPTTAPQMLTFEVTMTNLTLAQPLSPPAIFLHRSGYNAFTDGFSASEPLEILAEGGERMDLLDEATDADALLVAYSDANPIAPLTIGPTEQLSVLADEAADLRLTAVTRMMPPE